MGKYSNLAVGEEVTSEGDFLGGDYLLDSDVYQTTIDMAYTDKSRNGALGLHLDLLTKEGKHIKQSLWVTTGDAKGNLPTYPVKDKQGNATGELRLLPSMNIANSLCQLALGADFSEMDSEELTVKVYDYEARAEVNKAKDVIRELLGKPIAVGLLRVIDDKNVQDSQGNWVASGETRESNEIDKFFDGETAMTRAEVEAGATEAMFIKKWITKNRGNTKVKAKGAVAAAPTPGAGIAKPVGGDPDLFV